MKSNAEKLERKWNGMEKGKEMERKFMERTERKEMAEKRKDIERVKETERKGTGMEIEASRKGMKRREN